MKKHFFAFALICTLSLNPGCEKTLTESELEIHGRRDYVWVVDTLKASPGDLFYLFSLWGSSPHDIWAVGSADAAHLSKWHFDGISWKQDNIRLSSNLMSVYGFAKNDVWACDAPGLGVYHYNGQQWSTSYSYNESGTRLGLNNIWGETTNNIYAVGSIDSVSGGSYKGAILHYDGNNWNSISTANSRVGFNRIRRGIKESSRYYISGTQFGTSGSIEKAFEFDGNKITEIYSSTERGLNVNEINGRMYFTPSGGNQILKYSGSVFNVWKEFSSTNITLGLLWGRNEKDIFTQAFLDGQYGLGHFNGTDWELIYQMDAPISDVMIFDSEIFILYANRIIIHGKLQQP